MTAAPTDPAISARATAIARGLIATKRATGVISMESGMLRLDCQGGGFYWISLNGRRLLRGDNVWEEADELQPKFIEAMVRAGR